jgi:hypothetical protein
MSGADDVMRFVEKYMAEVPGGPAGDREMRRRDPSPFVDTTAADIGPDTLHGYVHRDGVPSVITDYDIDVEFDGQVMQTALSGTITDEDGRVTRVRTWRGADLHWPVSPYLTLHEASMHAEIEGVPGAAYIEMAWPPAYLAHHAEVEEADAAELTVDRRVELSERS